ncbi:MAG: hypothetical protein U5K56_12185 [Halioglobus sp.]|nr:hypothetical protein [Halioglobus sp.]
MRSSAGVTGAVVLGRTLIAVRLRAYWARRVTHLGTGDCSREPSRTQCPRQHHHGYRQLLDDAS